MMLFACMFADSSYLHTQYHRFSVRHTTEWTFRDTQNSQNFIISVKPVTNCTWIFVIFAAFLQHDALHTAVKLR